MANPSNLVGTSLTISVILGPKTVLKSLCISYIAFSPSTAPFVSFGGSLNKNKFTGEIENEIKHTIYRTPFVLLGIAQISLLETKPFDFHCHISEAFIIKATASRVFDSFAMTYIIVGKLPSQLCQHCGAGYLPYENECLTSCPKGTKVT